MGFRDLITRWFRPPTRLDVAQRFELERQALTGTMSKFRVAREIKTGRRLGIKFLDKEKMDAFNERFKELDKPSEGEIAMKIRHPHIVTTLEYGQTTTGDDYILMEYIDGPVLAGLITDRSPLLDGKRLTFIRQMAEGVQAVHDAGFIHRDICPRNFMCDRSVSSLKLIDFGLTLPDEPAFRQPGNRTGTPQYMAPEIIRRRATDRRVDIFALGVSVYRLLVGEHPWGSTETTGLAALAHDARPATDILRFRPDLDPAMAAAVHRCIEAQPEKRFESVNQFLSAIRNIDPRSIG